MMNPYRNMSPERCFRYLRNGLMTGRITREPFTYTYTQRTSRDDSRRMFVESVRVLKGEVVEENDGRVTMQGRVIYTTVAEIPWIIDAYSSQTYWEFEWIKRNT